MPKSALSNKPPQNAALYAAGKAAMLSALNYWHGLADDPKNLGYLEKVRRFWYPLVEPEVFQIFQQLPWQFLNTQTTRKQPGSTLHG